MSSVCFTGKGLRHGKQYTREFWEEDARAKGWTVHDAVGPKTEYLVASRTNTTKATAAGAYGTKVITYGEFEQMLRGQAPITAHNSGRVAPVIKPIDTSAMEDIPGWGLF